MKHEYSTRQVEEASDLASSGYTRIGINFLLDFLHHLPEPTTDDWQECTFEAIQKGDRVKNVLVRESGQIHTKEGVANRYEGHESGVGLSLWFMGDHDQYIARSDEPHGGPIKVTLYRIPAPVQHPDPGVHPVIIVSGAYDVEWGHAHAYVSDGAGYNLVEPIRNDSRLLPEAIHNWTPAKVVEDDR